MNLKTNGKKVKLLVAFLLLCISYTTQAQSKLTGKVIDENNQPLFGATVKIKKTNQTTTTNSNGIFLIEVPEGNYTIDLNYIGYLSITQELNTNATNTLIKLLPNTEVLEEVLVSGVRAKDKSPITHSSITNKEIAPRNLGQDIPVLMNYMPSVVTTTDAGAGVGYTGIRVRGSDATRVNVTINGIPYNDSESHGTYWVNMPDLASSTQSIQLQRGVGTSTNGAGAFGASLNLLTEKDSDKAFTETSFSTGSFNTQKMNVKIGTGKINDHVSFTGRISKITSDGYIDRASSNLSSYYLQGSYKNDKTYIKALVFGGHEKTYQSWNGNDGATLLTNRTFNSAGAKYDSNWNVIGYYDNEVDDYMQDHFQLHWNQKINKHFSSNIALHMTYGRGFYEQYKQDGDFNKYQLTPLVYGATTINSTDLIIRKWLSNKFYGTTYNLNYKNEDWDITFGGAANKYDGDHFGEIIWARYASNSEIRDHYYDYYGNKIDVNNYIKSTYNINQKLAVYTDLQLRNVLYQATVEGMGTINDQFNFFNPKAGISFDYDNHNNYYLSYAKAHREPNRTDYENGSPKPEKLDNFELGWRHQKNNIKLNSNIYYMFYTDQLALTGEIDGVGSPIRKNIGKSDRLGLELDAQIKLNKVFSIIPNFTISRNRNINYKETDGATITNFGNTQISYSPNVIAGNAILISPLENLNINVLSKYVGKQYMSNSETSIALLKSYIAHDINVSYTINPTSIFKEININGLVNNITNNLYNSNGYMWGTTPYYYPQAGTNFLVGATFKF